MFYLQTEDIMINYIILLWHWNVEAFKYEIFKPKKFRKILRNEPVVYILILSNKNENVAVDYVIELNEQNSSFKFLYNLLSLELKTL